MRAPMRALKLAGATALFVLAVTVFTALDQPPGNGQPISPSSVTSPQGNFDNIRWGNADGGTLVVQGSGHIGTTLRANTSVLTPFLDAGMVASADGVISFAAAGQVAFGSIDSAKTCFNTARTACMEWGGGTSIQTSAGFVSLGTLTASGEFRVADKISNAGTGANCTGFGSAVCVSDSAGAAFGDGSTATVAHVNSVGRMAQLGIIDAGVGAQTINEPLGRACVASGAASVTITSSQVTVLSNVHLTPMSSTAVNCVGYYVSTVAAGSFVITCPAGVTAADTCFAFRVDETL